MPETVALVIRLSGVRSHGYCPSLLPRAASGKMSTSIACSLPSAPLVDAAPTKSPALMSATLFLTMPATVKLGASTIVSTGPSRDFTVSVWPSSLSTVPRIRVGVPAGGAWARAGPTVRVMRAAAIANLRARLRIVRAPCSRVLRAILHRRLDAVLFRVEPGARQFAVLLLQRDNEHRDAGLQ